MKTKNYMLAFLQQLMKSSCVLLLTFISMITIVTAQDDPDNTNELQLVSKASGSGGGSGLNISKQNGSVIYSYPISQQSVGGHSLAVSLNYCASVAHNSFKYYDPSYDVWGGLNKLSPEWLLSVNGFVVQTLSTAIQFYSQSVHSNPLTNTRWVVEGYDYCNGMKNIGGSQQDIIKILRGNGSILELRNIYRGNTAPNDTLQRTGRYYSNAVNDKSYGYVYFDTTSWPSYIRPFTPYDNPRLLHYYPGDGLEYIFREHIAPYGLHNYSPIAETQTAGPIIFYLEEIRSGEQSISKFKYSRHYPTETNVDSTLNRAMISEFQGHRISINNAYMTIEALGRTFKVRYNSTWTGEVPYSGSPADSVLYPLGIVGGMGTKNGMWQNYNDNTFDYPVSTCGYVTEIFDPLDRATEFDYTFLKRKYHSTLYNSDCKLGLGRLTRISDISGYTTIDYYSGDGVMDSLTNVKKKLVYDFHTIASKVSSYNHNNTLLTSSSYSFDNSPSGYNRKTQVINFDSIAGLRDTAEYFYSYTDVAPYMVYNDATGEALAWAPLEKIINYSPLGKSTAVIKYSGDSLTGTRLMYVPIEHTISFKPVLNSVGTTTSHTKMEYQFTNLHDFDVDSSFGAFMAKGIAKQKIIEFYPHSDTTSVLDTMLISVKEYSHLQEVTMTVTRVDTVWDYKRSWFVTDSLRALGRDTTAIIYQTNSITSSPVIAPPIWGLSTRDFVMKSGDTLAGIMNNFQTILSTSAPRGALLSDTLRGSNGVKQEGAKITYRGGWYRNFPFSSTDINGAKNESLFNYSNAPEGTMVATTNSQYSRKLFNIRNEFEMPLGSRSFVRKPAGSLGGVVNDTLQGFAEYGYYGSPIASIDASGYYAATEYDNIGRATMSWQTFDFPPVWTTKTDRIRLYDTKTIKLERPDTLICADTSYRTGAWTETSSDPMKLYCYTYNTQFENISGCNDSIIRTGTSHLELGKITYRAHSSDRLHNGSVTDVTLSMFISILNLASDPNSPIGGPMGDPQSVRLSIPRLGFAETYIFGTADSLGASHLSSLSAFNVVLPDDVVDSLVAMGSGDTISIIIENLTAYQEFEILTLADDLAPAFIVSYNPEDAFVISGSPNASDFSVAISYDDATLSTTALGKIDDSYRTSNTNFTTSTSGKYGRYAGGTSEYDKINHAGRSIGFMGNPFSPSRLDTVKATMTGSGIPLRATDPEGRTVFAKYDFQRSKDTLFNTDNTFVISTQNIDNPLTFSISDQNFYGLCKAQFGTDERGIVSAQYFDALGQLRRTVTNKNGLDLTVRYEYDLMGNINKVISPTGDTTKYWYDNWGNLRAAYQPDVGTTSYAYDKMGNVRYIQTDRQSAENKLTFIQYDDFGRVTLTGEAKLSSMLIASLQSYSAVYPNPTPSVRLTDAIGADTLHTTTGTLPPVTVNTSLYVAPAQYPPTLTVNADTVSCLPSPATALTYEIGPIKSPYLKRAADYWLPAAPTACNRSTFENVSTYPENVLQAISYDKLPQQIGAVWTGFPASNLWDSLAPTGVVRHLKGQAAAVAYRQNNAQPFHYQVYSYDERGRVEALIRFTENLGFEAVYYNYNSADLPILVRTADPFNQHAVWYSYDQNGRVDSVYSTLWENHGVGWTGAKRPSLPTKPSTPDTWFSYARRGYADTVYHATAGGTAKIISHLDVRGRLDTMKANVGVTSVLNQNLGYDASSNITRKTEAGTGSYFGYDDAGRMIWEATGSDTTFYDYDDVGKRLHRTTPTSEDTLLYSGNKLTEHRRATDTTSYTRDSEGAVTGMNTKTAGTAFVQRETLGYDAAGMTTQYKVNVNAPTPICFPRPKTQSTDSTKDWRYRHGAGGLREQRRLYYSPQGDSCLCIMEWTYYLRGAGQEVRAVWTGRQTADIDTCGNTARRVVYYPVEYMGAGGADYTRAWDGSWRKEFRIKDYLGSIRTIVQASGNFNFSYGPYGKPTSTTERWSYLGQEKDKETVGLNEFDYRKYQSETGSFLRPDPLWALAPDVSSFVYGNSSPLVFSDPSGLIVESAVVFSDGTTIITEVSLASPLAPGKKTHRLVQGGGGGNTFGGLPPIGGESTGGNSAGGLKDISSGRGGATGEQQSSTFNPVVKTGQNTDGKTHTSKASDQDKDDASAKLESLRKNLRTKDVEDAHKGNYEIGILIYTDGTVSRFKGKEGEGKVVLIPTPGKTVSVIYHNHPGNGKTSFSGADIYGLLELGVNGTLSVLGNPWEFTALQITDKSAASEWFINNLPDPVAWRGGDQFDDQLKRFSDPYMANTNPNEGLRNLVGTTNGLKMYSIKNGKIRK